MLEEPYHLSYPFVFARGRAPSGFAGVFRGGHGDLYRATRYPGGWVKEATLLSRRGRERRDAPRTGRPLVALRHRARRPPRRPGGIGVPPRRADLWSAPDFRGPYVPHPANPVLVDPSFARPAGRIVRAPGAPDPSRSGLRPRFTAAPCRWRGSTGWTKTGSPRPSSAGSSPGRLGPAAVLHTLNAGGGIECNRRIRPGFAPQGAARRLEPHPAPGETGTASDARSHKPSGAERASPCAPEPRSGISIRDLDPMRVAAEAGPRNQPALSVFAHEPGDTSPS